MKFNLQTCNAFVFVTFVLFYGQMLFAQFIPHELSYSLASPNSVLCFDVDGDGYPDVVAGSTDDNKIVWYRNLQNDSFGEENLITSYASGTRNIVQADIDNDGDLDIVSSNYGESAIVCYPNLGAGSFGPGIALTNSFLKVDHIQTGDVDNDGWVDIIGISSETNLVAWLPNASGVFGNLTTISTQNVGPLDLELADLDGDNFPDLICGFSGNTGLWHFMNTGTGGFAAPQLINTEVASIYDVIAQDVDGDGDQDLVYATPINDKVKLVRNQGSATFDNPLLICQPDYPTSLRFWDVDSDLVPDLLLSAFYDSQIEWCRNLGGGAFDPSQVLVNFIPGSLSSFVVEDMTNDGLDDFIGAYEISAISVEYLKNMGNSTFTTTAVLTPEINRPLAATTGDLNGDGLPEVVFGQTQRNVLSYYLNEGSIAMDSVVPVLELPANGNYDIKNVRLCDLDVDGDLDILAIFGTPTDTIFWMQNDGNGSFGAPTSLTSWSIYNSPETFELGDMDGDGYVDIISTTEDIFNDYVRCYLNDGTGNFPVNFDIDGNAGNALGTRLNDFDQDGDLDIFVVAYSDQVVGLYENLGGGSFGARQTITSFSASTLQMFLADMDGDGWDDILTSAIYSTQINWYRNLGNGTFAVGQLISNQGNNITVLPIDIDGDSDMDILSYKNINAFTPPQITFLENLGGSFATNGPNLFYGWGNVECGAFVPADLDLDGDPDVIEVGGGKNASIWVLENELSYTVKGTGKIFVDENLNQQYDAGEVFALDVPVLSSPVSGVAYTNYDGTFYVHFSGAGNSTVISPQLPNYWGIVTDSLSYTLIVDSVYQEFDSLDFGLYPTLLVDSALTDISGPIAHCSWDREYWLTVRNTGSTRMKGYFALELDPQVSIAANPGYAIPDSVVGNMCYWSVDTLDYFADTSLRILLTMPDWQSAGDTLLNVLTFFVTDAGGNIYYSSVDTLEQVVVCAIDPNDKIAEAPGMGPGGYIPLTTESIDYTIRFQNTGNDTAYVITLKDQLDPSLNWQNLIPLASSHPMQLSIDNNGLLTIIFDQIMLPDSATNEPESHGFAKYRISLLPGLSAGTVIENAASIYFDQNPPVITNTKLHTLFDCQDIFQSVGSLTNPVCEGVSLAYTPILQTDFMWNIPGVTSGSGNNFYWQTDTSGVFMMNLLGTNEICSQDTTVQLQVNALPQVSIGSLTSDTLCTQYGILALPQGTPSGGIYSGAGVTGSTFDPSLVSVGSNEVIYWYTDNNGCGSGDTLIITVVDCAQLLELASEVVMVYPNPANDKLIIQYTTEIASEADIQLWDLAGSRFPVEPVVSGNTLELDLRNMSKGMYTIVIGWSDPARSTEMFSVVIQ